MGKLKGLDWLALILAIIGGLNWGLVGLFNLDVVRTLFGEMSPLSRIIYTLVGLAAIWMVGISGKLARK